MILYRQSLRPMRFGCLWLFALAAVPAVGDDTSEIRSFRGVKRHFAACMEFSPDGKLLVTCGVNGDKSVVCIWSVDNLKIRNVIPITTTGEKFVALAPNGKWLAFRDTNQSFVIWNIRENRKVKQFRRTVEKGSFSPDSTVFASVDGRDHSVWLWTAKTGELVRTLRSNDSKISSLSFSPDGKTLATACYGGKIILWDWNSGKQLASWRVDYMAFAVVYSLNGQWLVTAGTDGGTDVWDARTRKHLKALPNSVKKAWGYELKMSHDSKTLVTFLENIRSSDVWGFSGAGFKKLGPSLDVATIAFSPDGKFAFSTEDGWRRLEIVSFLDTKPGSKEKYYGVKTHSRVSRHILSRLNEKGR